MANEEELKVLLTEYICTPRTLLSTHQTQALLQQISPERRLALLKQQSGSYRYTALHCAAVRSHPETIESILMSVPPEKRFELLEVQDNGGQTALHRAAIGGNIGCIKCLLSSLSSPELQMELLMLTDQNGKTATKRAIHFKKIQAAILLGSWKRQLTGRIDKKKSFPKGSTQLSETINYKVMCRNFDNIII